MAGRKSKLTAELTEVFCENIELGLSYNLSCQAVGITFATFNEWMKAGAKGKDKIFCDFYNAVRASEAACAKKCLTRIRAAAERGSLAGDMWLLERRYPADYGRKDKLDLKAQTENLNVDVTTEQAEADALRSKILCRLSIEAEPEF